MLTANRHISRSLDRFRTPVPQHELPELPEDPTGIDDRGLMELFSALTAWCEYADEIHAEACAAERELETNLARRQAEATTRSDKKTVTAQRAMASLNLEVQNAEGGLLVAYRNRKRAEAAIKKAERRLSVVSRELTRRSSPARGRM